MLENVIKEAAEKTILKVSRKRKFTGEWLKAVDAKANVRLKWLRLDTLAYEEKKVM